MNDKHLQIEIDNMSKVYGGKHAVQKLTLTVDPDAPDRNRVTCTEYDELNRPVTTRAACVPGQPDYLASGKRTPPRVTCGSAG